MNNSIPEMDQVSQIQKDKAFQLADRYARNENNAALNNFIQEHADEIGVFTVLYGDKWDNNDMTACTYVVRALAHIFYQLGIESTQEVK